jgi:hypothetical protein
MTSMVGVDEAIGADSLDPTGENEMMKMFEVVSPTGSWVAVGDSVADVLNGLADLGYSEAELESLVVSELPVETVSLA